MSKCSTSILPATAPSENAPPSFGRLIRLPEVMDRVGMKRSAIYQRMREGSFPRSRSLGSRCAVWVEAEIEEWVHGVVRP